MARSKSKMIPWYRLRGSVRARLTLWNTVTFAAVLVCIGISFRLLAQAYLLSGLDRELHAHTDVQTGAVTNQILVLTTDFIARTGRDQTATITTKSHGQTIAPVGVNIVQGNRLSIEDSAARPTRAEVTRVHETLQGDPTGQFQYRSFNLDGKPQQASLVSTINSLGGEVRLDTVGDNQAPGLAAYRPWDADGFSAASRGSVVTNTVTSEGDMLRVLSRPIREGNQITGVRQIATSLSPLHRDLNGLTRSLFLLLPPALIIALLAGLFLTNKALSPVKSLTVAARQIRPDQLTRRLPLNGTDEFDELAATFNSALGRVESAFKDRERMVAQLQRFTGDASHELRTPLTTIKANTTVALSETHPSEDHLHALRKIDRAADRMTALVEDLLLLARFDGIQAPLDARPVSVRQLAEEAVELLPEARPAIDIAACPGQLMVLAEPGHIVRLLRNLLENSRKFTPEEGLIEVRATQLAQSVEIRVVDSGSGIAPEHLPFLGERLFRADTARSRSHGGAGLGLAICKSIAERHGGTLKFVSTPGSGTTVIVTLPSA
jgi:signal transduction histidine kinase